MKTSVNASSKSDLSTLKNIPLSPPSGIVSEHEQIPGQKLRIRYWMFVIYEHPVIAATRALRFANHLTKRNGGSGDENERSEAAY